MSNLPANSFPRLAAKLKKLQNIGPLARQVAEHWVNIIVEDNRLGVLKGLDCHDQPMAPVKYRGSLVAASKGLRARQGQNFGITVGRFKGFGPDASGLHGNLSRKEYQKLSGPPLAPRGEESRVIANLHGRVSHNADETVWVAEAAWLDVVSTKGIPFLKAHFTGANVGKGLKVKLPVRDLRGVRQWGMEKARAVLKQFVDGVIGP
jgi:hypothetical protein